MMALHVLGNVAWSKDQVRSTQNDTIDLKIPCFPLFKNIYMAQKKEK